MKPELAAAVFLGAAQGDIRLRKHHVTGFQLPSVGTDADADSDADPVPIDHVRCCDALEEPRGQIARMGGIGQFAVQNGELVAAESRDQIGRADTLAEALRDFLQKPVPDRVPEVFIDWLEPVQIQVQRGKRGGTAPRSGEHLPQPVHE